jgi:hypothetical protein
MAMMVARKPTDCPKCGGPIQDLTGSPLGAPDAVTRRFNCCYMIGGILPEHRGPTGEGPWMVSCLMDGPSFSGVPMKDFCEACRKVAERMNQRTAEGQEIVAGGFCPACGDRIAAASTLIA